MRCSEVSSLLELSDLDARLDRARVGRHFASCSQCACRFPEVVLLLGAGMGDQGGVRRAARRIAAALVVAAVVGVMTIPERGGASPPESSVARTSAPAVSEIRRGSDAAVSLESVRFDRGQRFESRVTSMVWTAPMPKCMQQGGSGS